MGQSEAQKAAAAAAAAIAKALPGQNQGEGYTLGTIQGVYNTPGFYHSATMGGLLDKLGQHPNDLFATYQWLTGAGQPASRAVMLDTVRKAWNAAGSPQGALANAYPEMGGYNPTTGTRRGASSNTASYMGGYAGTADMSGSAMMSAYSNVLSTLHNWNLDSLTDKAWQMISNPGFHMNAGEVVDALRNSDEYKQAFPGMAEIRAKGLNISEGQYINREMDIQDQFAQNGIPQGMLTKDQLGKMVAGGVYGRNLQDRIIKGYEAVKNADPMVKQTLQKWYGVQPGHLLGYMLSPEHGMQQIVKEVQAANIKTESHLAGFQGLDRKTAQELSKQMSSGTYGMDYFRQGFAKAAGLQPLESAQVGMDGQATASKQQILGATFAGLRGSTPNATQAVQLATQARTAGLSGGGGYAATQQGVTGAGSAPT